MDDYRHYYGMQRSYVLLADPAIAVHHVKAQRAAESKAQLSPELAARGVTRGTIDASLEILNVLVPSSQVSDLYTHTNRIGSGVGYRDTLLIAFSQWHDQLAAHPPRHYYPAPAAACVRAGL